MSSWELVTSLIWFPIAIMQRVSRQFFLLGRTVYGSLFGTRPAIKPGPPPNSSSPTSKSPLQSSSFSKDKSTSHVPSCVIDMDGNESPAIPKDDLEQLLSATKVNSAEEVIMTSRADDAAAASVVVVNDSNTGSTMMRKGNNNDKSSDDRLKRSRDVEKRRLMTMQKKQQLSSSDNNAEASSSCNSIAVGGAKQLQSDCPPESKRLKLSSTAKGKAEPSSSISATATATAVVPENNDKKRKKRAKKGNKTDAETANPSSSGKMGRPGPPPPNFFIAVQIADKEIVDKVSQLQKNLSEKKLEPPWHGLSTTQIFIDAMVPVQKLHFTLHVIHLSGEEDVEKAKSAFNECCLEVNNDFLSSPLDITIAGLGHFRNSVIFAQIKDETHISRLTKLADLFRRKFSDACISGDPRPFKPHLTIGKISRSNKLHKKKIRSFPPDIWAGHEDIHFGTQRVKGVQLLFMSGEDKSTGYYRCLSQHNFEDSASPSAKTIQLSPANKITDTEEVNDCPNNKQ